MSLGDLVTFVVLSYVTYRVTRFTQKDSLLQDLRAWFFPKLLGPPTFAPFALDDDGKPKMPEQADPSWWRIKLYELLTCPYCWSAWVAAGAVALADWRISIPLPVFMWVAVAGGAMSVWRQVEDE